MLRTRLLVGLLPDLADRISFSTVTLIGCHVLYAAVTMFSVVQAYKAIHTGSHREKIPEATQRIALVVFHRAES
jgi:hypothetical protein